MAEQTLHEADLTALRQLQKSAPAWTGIRTARDVLELPPRTLLHCGPPADPANALVVPTLNSAAVACVFEGWAKDFQEADALLRGGEIEFRPAQDHHVATPLAAVVSPSMQLLELCDLNAPERRTWAPLNGGGTGGDPAPRYGRKTEAALDLIRFLNDQVAPAIAAAGKDPVPWLPIIDNALVNGDDVHLRHVAAHAQLNETLRSRLGDGYRGSAADEFISQWPIFHLNFWMAAGRCMLDAAEGVTGSGLITAFGGNGEHFGLQVSGLPRRWFSVPASVPRGKLREPHTPETCTGAYGDSALVEGIGLGAMAHRYCPDMQALHKDYYTDDLLDLPASLLLGEHPSLPQSGARVGLSVRTIVSTGITPVVELGIVDKAGVDGGLGAGLYRPPLEPFASALSALAAD